MNFQTRLRKELMAFSIKLIIIVTVLFVAVTLVIGYVNNNIQMNDGINNVDYSFNMLNKKIDNQIQHHNFDSVYLDAINDKTIDRKMVSTNNYSFSKSMNSRYNYNIYDMNLDGIYLESYSSSPRYNLYLEIIKERVISEDELEYIVYNDLNSDMTVVIYYGGLYLEDKLIAIDTYSIDVNDLSYSVLPNTGDYVITDRFHNIIASNNNDILNDCLNFDCQENYYLNSSSFKVTKINKGLYNIYFLEENVSLKKYYSVIAFVFLSILLLVVFLSNKIIKKLAKENTKSIESIIEDIDVISKGDLEHKINDNLDVELGGLACNINKMLGMLNAEIRLNKELSETNIIFERKKLDSQFDPHFLYNSLETIRYGMMIDTLGTEQYILKLNQILRYSIDNKISYSLLKDDINYLEKYLELYKYRFKDKLEYSIIVESNMLGVLVPKLSIQPLVGNSIKYCFNNSVNAKIEIHAFKENGRCYLQIYDNGTSIDDSIVEELNIICNSNKNSTNHIGVHNVVRRFKLLYTNSTLKVKKSVEGTMVEISFTEETRRNV